MVLISELGSGEDIRAVGKLRFHMGLLSSGHQGDRAQPSLGFSRQEHWSGLPFPSPMHESER